MDLLERLNEELADRYAIERELGSGGMATVYLARDLKHPRHVAIKVLKPEIAAISGPDRFLREISLLAQFKHPNTLTLIESGQADNVPYFIMEYIEGESLARRLEREGQLPIDEAIRIAREVADALDRAHKSGIVHRDIKPANILLEEGHAYVADFGVGLALHDAADELKTTVGISLGTPGYMSPEQATGKADLDGRCDLYALGCVLYEMLAGHQPFSGDSLESIVAQQLTGPAPSVARHRDRVPVAIDTAIRTALARSPADRFQTAADFSAACRLEEDTAGHAWPAPPETQPGPGPPTLRTFVRRRPGVAATIALALFAIPGLASSQGRRIVAKLASMLAPAAPKYVAVLPFMSTDSADAVLAAGLTRSFTQLVSELADGNPSVWVLSFSDMLDAGVSTPAGIRRIYPVDLVVTGEIQRDGGHRVLEVELFDARQSDPRHLSSLVISRPMDSLSLASARTLLGRTLGVSAPATAGDATAAWAASPARRYYLLGVGQMQRAYDVGSLESAIGLFESAIDEDSTFGAAFAGLCEAFWERYMQTGEAAFADDAMSMCDRGVELSRFDPAALVALGRTQFFTGQLERAEQTLREAIQRNAGADAHRWLGHVFEDMGMFEEAEREHRQAIALRDDIWVYYAALGMLYMNAERHEEAIEFHREVIRLSPDNYVGYHNLGASLMLMYRLDAAEEQLRRSIQVRPTPLAYRNLGYLGLLRQRYDEAIASLRLAISHGPEDWWSWRWLAHAHHWRGEGSEARGSWRRVVELLEFRLDFNPNNQDMLCGMAEALIALGETERGVRSLDYLASLDIIRAYNVFWTGRLYEMLGSRRAALQYVAQALERGFDPNTVGSDPWLVSLRSDPAYEGSQERS